MPASKHAPRVSVAFPSFNHARYIGPAIESILAQSFQDFEIVITDDGSTDGTADVIRSYKDPRIFLVALAENRTACVAGNATIRRARGEYIANLSSDDMCVPGRLATQVSFLDEHANIAAVFGQPEFIDDHGQKLQDGETFYGSKFRVGNRSQEEWLRLLFFEGNHFCHPTMMIRRDCFDRVGFYNPALAQLPDYDMWLRLLPEHNVHVLDETMVRFRILPNLANASAPRPEVIARLQFEQFKVLENYLNLDDAMLRRIFPEIPADATSVTKPSATARLAQKMLGRIAAGTAFQVENEAARSKVRNRPAAWHLAELALGVGMPAYVAFGLQTMFKLLPQIDDDSVYREFIAYTGSHDPFGALRRPT